MEHIELVAAGEKALDAMLAKPAPYPVMDPTGQVKAWLDAGRGVAVWKSKLIGEYAPDILTPGDAKSPGWRYGAQDATPARVLGPDDVIYFKRAYAVADYSDSRAGFDACYRKVKELTGGRDQVEREAPIGTVYERYTVDHLSCHSEAMGEQTPPRPLLIRYRSAVILWTAIVRK